jgi:uncharacterized flavoprotein (TIGR03862 family)
MTQALVIGAGPAGLMAAETLAASGMSVIITEAKPSVGRKFLMAGKSGLNITKDEALAPFMEAFAEAAPAMRPALEAFGPDAVQDWSRGLGQEVFTGSSGRVFPVAMKASPLLRAWLRRLEGLGVDIRTRWRWTGFENGFRFETPQGVQVLTPDVAILACGGASWARLGSDGCWTKLLPNVPCAPFQPANMGFVVAWSDHMKPYLGHPVKGIALHAGDTASRGEIVLSASGIEGGGIYAVSRALREGAGLTLDLLPDLSLAQVTERLARQRGKATMSNHLRKVLRLDPVKLALLLEFGQPVPNDGAAQAALLKALPVPLCGPRPIDQAISTAGGLRFAALDEGFMIRQMPGVFAAGEMLDWEAPTGGYLITGALATGRWAAQHAVQWVADQGTKAP